MPMTVQELLNDPDLGLRVVVDGALDRPIRWVHTTELADPSRYLQGGELILTTGVWRDAGLTSERLRRAASGHGRGRARVRHPDGRRRRARRPRAGLPPRRGCR